MRSGFCSPCKTERGPTHDRCRMESCSCPWHNQDLLEKSAKMVADSLSEAVGMPVPEEPADPPRPLWDAVADVAFGAVRVSGAATNLDALPPEECLRILYGLRDAIDHLRDVDAALTQRIYLAGEHGDVQVEGLPVAKITRGRVRKEWDAEGATRAYVDSQMVERAGELPTPDEVVSWVLSVVGASYCKVTPLRAVGLDPQDFCSESPGKISVQFVE